MAKVTLQFLAEKLGVSKSLVSKVLNGKQVGVSDAVRQKILDAAKEYHYSPNRMAASLSHKKSQIIGCIIPNMYFHYFGQLSYWIERSAHDCGYNVLLCNADEKNKREREYLKLHQTGIVDGMIIMPCDDHSNLDIYNDMMQDGFPFVFLDRFVNGVSASVISTDNKEAYYYMTMRLIEKGHQRILFIGHNLASATSIQTERYRGYAKAMREMNLDEQMVNIMADIDVENHFLAGVLSLPKDKRPTALVMVSSEEIRPILKICKLNGITVPEDLDIASIDEVNVQFTTQEDLDLVRVVKEPMLILEQKPKNLAKKAVEFLVDQIERGNTEPRVYRAHAMHCGTDVEFKTGGK